MNLPIASVNEKQNKTCIDCPSYLTSKNAPRAFKKSIGAAVCGSLGKVLDRPGIDDRQARAIAEQSAKNCSEYGKPFLIAKKVQPDFRVAFPVDLENANAPDSTVTTCAMCANYIGDYNVSNELGWAAGLCAAKGKLIPSNRQSVEASGCEKKVYGPSTLQSTSSLTLFPVFVEGFGMENTPERVYLASGGAMVEPTQYPTDKTITDEDTTEGIRAYRKVMDPEGTGKFAFLPIFEPSFFSDIEQSKIPKTGDDEHPELYVDHFGGAYMAAVVWTELDEVPALWGEAGVGKTELFRYLAWMMCLPFERISITATTDNDDLIGKTLYTKERGTYFQYGRLPKAWNKPCVVVLDEPNTGQPEVWQAIRPLTDNSKQLVVDSNQGERVVRNGHTYLGFAMNPAWDPKNVGTQQIGDADASRLFHIFIGMPPESLEREIIKARVKLDGWEIEEAQLKMLMGIATDIRALVKDDTLPITWGIRPQIKVARALKWFDAKTAYRRAIGDFLEPAVVEMLLDVVKSHVVEEKQTKMER